MTDTTFRTTPSSRYLAPGWFTRRVFNPFIAGMTGLGISVKGSRVLEVRGRTSGTPRRAVVNLLTLDGQRFLVAPRGTTQWVRNLRAAGVGSLRLGRQRETFSAVELPDEAKCGVLRGYLDEWAWEVGKFFDGLTASSTDAELAAAAPAVPVFRVEVA
jgi:deazaflavin-dependent oxidoreductase (nitroreductase family)